MEARGAMRVALRAFVIAPISFSVSLARSQKYFGAERKSVVSCRKGQPLWNDAAV